MRQSVNVNVNVNVNCGQMLSNVIKCSRQMWLSNVVVKCDRQM